jgi:hypothetical protein
MQPKKPGEKPQKPMPRKPAPTMPAGPAAPGELQEQAALAEVLAKKAPPRGRR